MLKTRSTILSDELITFTQSLSKFPSYLFTVHKNQPEDIMTYRSDYDLRIIVDCDSAKDIIKINNYFYEAFLLLINNSADNFRKFEHPPVIINLRDLEMGIRDNEAVTWTFVDGNRLVFDSFERKLNNKKFSISDFNYYYNILKIKKNYELDRELFYDHLSITKQKRHCLVWHYYAPSIAAYAAIYYKKRMSGKLSSIKVLGKEFQSLRCCNARVLSSLVDDDNINCEYLKKILKQDIDILEHKIKITTLTRNINLKESNFSIYIRYITALSFIRKKIPQFKIYIDYVFTSLKISDTFINNVVIREIQELEKAKNNLLIVIIYLQTHNLDNKMGFDSVILKIKEVIKVLDNKEVSLLTLEKYLRIFNRFDLELEEFAFILYNNFELE